MTAAAPTASAAMAASEAEELAKFDLTSKLTPFLDKHLIFPILQVQQELGLYKQEDITRAELQLLTTTNMIDFAMDKYKELGEEVPESLAEKREEVLGKLEAARENEISLLETLEDD
jgi:translation initiation factor 3 subunit E